MIPLVQEHLEDLLQNKVKGQPPFCVIYFTAKWCGPCNGLPLKELIASNPNLHWYLCDVDDNNYSSGYCGVKSIPAFMSIINGKSTNMIASSDPNNIIPWLQGISH